MKRAIEAIRLLRDGKAAAEKTHRGRADQVRGTQDLSDPRSRESEEWYLDLATQAAETVAELDAAIKLLEAAPAVRELVRQGAALLRSTTSTSSSGWTALAAVLADPTLRALIDESAAGAGGDDG